MNQLHKTPTGELPARHTLIGLTGNIATGKSEVARLLAELGAHVIDADKIAHEVMQPGGPAYEPVVKTFGQEILATGGTVGARRGAACCAPTAAPIDRKKLGDIVFRDPEALRQLEMAVHPATLAKVGRLIAQAMEPIIVVEAIKLIEAGMHRICDALWVVTAPRLLQIRRLMSTRGLSKEEAELRVDAQPPQEEKAALADVVIVNDGSMDELRQKVQSLWTELQVSHHKR